MQAEAIREVHNNLLKELGEKLNICEKVAETVNTPGFKDIIGPMIDKMIIDVVGGKQNGRWHNGSLGDKRLKEATLQNLCWYKRALTDLHEYIYQYVDSLDGYRSEYDRILADELNPQYTDLETEYEE